MKKSTFVKLIGLCAVICGLFSVFSASPLYAEEGDEPPQEIAFVVSFDPDMITVGDYRYDPREFGEAERIRNQEDTLDGYVARHRIAPNCGYGTYAEHATIIITPLDWLGTDHETLKPFLKDPYDQAANFDGVPWYDTEFDEASGEHLQNASSDEKPYKRQYYGLQCAVYDLLDIHLASNLAVPYKPGITDDITFQITIDPGDPSYHLKKVIADPRYKDNVRVSGNTVTISIPQYIDKRRFKYDEESRVISFVPGADGSPDVIQWIGYDLIKYISADLPGGESAGGEGEALAGISASQIFSFVKGIEIGEIENGTTVARAFKSTRKVSVNPRQLGLLLGGRRNGRSRYTGLPISSCSTYIFTHEFHHIFSFATVLDREATGLYTENTDEDTDMLPKWNYYGLFPFTYDRLENGFVGDDNPDKNPKKRAYCVRDNPVPRNDNIGVYRAVGLSPINTPFYIGTAGLTNLTASVVIPNRPLVSTWANVHNLDYVSIIEENSGIYGESPGLVTAAYWRVGKMLRKVLGLEDYSNVPTKCTTISYVETKLCPCEYDADRYAYRCDYYLSH